MDSTTPSEGERTWMHEMRQAREQRTVETQVVTVRPTRGQDHTLVVVVMGGRTKNREDATTWHWWPDLWVASYFVFATDSGKREHDRGTCDHRKPPQLCAHNQTKTHATRSRAAGQYDDGGQEVVRSAKH